MSALRRSPTRIASGAVELTYTPRSSRRFGPFAEVKCSLRASALGLRVRRFVKGANVPKNISRRREVMPTPRPAR